MKRSALFRSPLALASLLLATLSLMSCRHKDLYDPELHVTSRLQIVFDWSKAPDANPSSMAAYLFEETGDQPMRYIFADKNGGEIKAPCGTRHILFLNADNTDWLRILDGDHIESARLLTQDAPDLSAQGLQAATLPRATDSERVAATPGMLWGGRSDNHRIRPHTGMQTITLTPEELVCHYTVDIYDITNVSSLTYSSVDATLSGMAEGYGLGATCATDTPVTMPFELKVDKEASSMHSEFLTFGECSSTQATHLLTVYMLMTDGSRWWHSFDVTSQVTQAPDPRHVHIIIYGLHLPDAPTVPGTSVRPDVNVWKDVNIDIEM